MKDLKEVDNLQMIHYDKTVTISDLNTRVTVIEETLGKDVPEIKKIVKSLEGKFNSFINSQSSLRARQDTIDNIVSEIKTNMRSQQKEIDTNTNFREQVLTIWKLVVFVFGGQFLTFIGTIIYIASKLS